MELNGRDGKVGHAGRLSQNTEQECSMMAEESAQEGGAIHYSSIMTA